MANLSIKPLADRVVIEPALAEQKTDMQLSTFLLIVDSLGLTLNFSEKTLAQAL